MLFPRSTFVLYEYDPSLAAAVIFAALFILTTGFHFYQRFRSHAKYFNPFIVGGVFQVIGYIARARAHFDQTSTTLYSVQTLLLLLAPTLYAASIYMVLGRIITFLNAPHLSVIRVKWMTKIFVSGDILSFILQGAGGGIMANGSTSSMKIGQINRNPTAESDKTMSSAKRCLPKDWRGLLFACYFVSVLILIRSVYRLIEFAQGNSGYVISHEVFLYVLDASMMFLVMLTMNLFHPSIVLQDGVYHQRLDLDELSLRREGGDV
ncbi:hypothetical protein ALUC_10630S [Aspergillus luchuensis]|nr:hypothetical protein ALUC_10630S [Aspergillus luchuensis]